MEPLIRINTQKVIGRMAELGYTKTSLAAALGIDRSTLAKYLKNPDVMPYGIMAKMALLLCMERYFFADPEKTREHLPATPDPEALNMCAFLLDCLGWHTQQGRHDFAMNWITELCQMHPDAFLKAIANGLAVIRNALDQIETEQRSGIPDTLTVLESHCKTHIPENTQL